MDPNSDRNADKSRHVLTVPLTSTLSIPTPALPMAASSSSSSSVAASASNGRYAARQERVEKQLTGSEPLVTHHYVVIFSGPAGESLTALFPGGVEWDPLVRRVVDAFKLRRAVTWGDTVFEGIG